MANLDAAFSPYSALSTTTTGTPSTVLIAPLINATFDTAFSPYSALTTTTTGTSPVVLIAPLINATFDTAFSPYSALTTFSAINTSLATPTLVMPSSANSFPIGGTGGGTYGIGF